MSTCEIVHLLQALLRPLGLGGDDRPGALVTQAAAEAAGPLCLR